MSHRWTAVDDTTLMSAVEACLPMQAAMRGLRVVWWAAVCGRMGFTDVSPDSARTRYQRLLQEANGAKEGGWDRVAHQVEEYEQSLLESAVEQITVVRRKIDELSVVVTQLMREWKGTD